jgi:hypothetical protein
MPLSAAQQQEVERTIERLRTSTGTWISDARAAEIIGALIAERDEAHPPFTDDQAMAVESLNQEVMDCPIAGICRRYHIELPIETATTLRALIETFRP